MRIISRAEWGAKPWRSGVYSVPASERDWFVVHYHGGEPRYDRGDANAREIESIHLNNGWSGVGYNFIVGQDGAIREGRGWNLVGAHCPGKNRSGIGVYVAIGGSQKPSKAALESVRALYAEASRRSGKNLIKSYHGYDYPTACPGSTLRAWVQGGMKSTVVGQVSAIVTNTVTAVKKSTATPGKLVVDGRLGPSTYSAIQKWVGTKQDGIWGPATRKALQKKLGVTADGIVGRGTVRALQRRVGVLSDGIWGPNTTKALQRYLNKNVL